MKEWLMEIFGTELSYNIHTGYQNLETVTTVVWCMA